jgi:AcrR family transcriptional regulator
MIQQDRVLNIAEQLFLAEGIRSVTMDVIAKRLFVSKKTIYKLFRDKNDLVIAIVIRKTNGWKVQISEVIKQEDSVFDAMAKLTNYSQATFLNFNRLVIEDLKKYHAEAWRIFQDFKNVFVVGTIESLLARGKVQGCLRTDLNESIISRMRLSQLEITFNQEIYPLDKFDRTNVKEELLNLFHIGIILN